jgi:hypothetical protein
MSIASGPGESAVRQAVDFSILLGWEASWVAPKDEVKINAIRTIRRRSDAVVSHELFTTR